MARIEAFRGIRYDLGHVGSLSDVVAPPYDVINPEFQSELYKKHLAKLAGLSLEVVKKNDRDLLENEKALLRAAIADLRGCLNGIASL